VRKWPTSELPIALTFAGGAPPDCTIFIHNVSYLYFRGFSRSRNLPTSWLYFLSRRRQLLDGVLESQRYDFGVAPTVPIARPMPVPRWTRQLSITTMP